MRVGIFGGTFDPVHIGHLVAAVNVRHALGLDRVMMVPAHDPWQKASREITPAEDRYAVLAACVAGIEGLVASRIEIDRGGVSYTVDTVLQVSDMYPGVEVYLVVGEDVARNLVTWDRSDELRSMVSLVVVNRPLLASDRESQSGPTLKGALKASGRGAGDRGGELVQSDVAVVPPGWSGVSVEIPNLDISSTDLRARVAEGRPLEFLVPEGGIQQIRARGLYASNR
ncbi:MAG: nicotinate-nucleotide adenylyltransferase [Actinomycetota bacterium]|nr:nicotinate-nucleotide adenylyltransferase [Actinomycetota bacterium]